MDEWFFARRGSRSGPHNAEEMRTFAENGEIAADTLCWHKEFGADWKPFSATGLAVEADGPPPLPPAHVPDGWAWAIALTPLVGGIVQLVLNQNGDNPSQLTWMVIFFLVQTAFVIVDAKAIDRAGHGSYGDVNARPSTWWLLFVPVYLWKRGTFLRKRRVPFWVYIACSIVGVALEQPSVAGDTPIILGIPSCSGEWANTNVSSVFNDIGIMKAANVTFLRLDNPEEVSSTDQERVCRGSILASDDKKHPADYRFEKQDDGKIYVHLQVHAVDGD